MATVTGMKDFSRVIWSNGSEKWQSIISQISKDWIEFERITVKKRIRTGFIANILPKNIPEFFKEWTLDGCSVVILGTSAISDSYSSRNVEIIEGEPFTLRCLVYRINRVFPFSYEDEFIGEILGYPECCIKFFDEWWNKKNFIDTTWPMAQNTIGDFAPKCNILLRYLGIRPVFHLPCSLNCRETIYLATKYINYFEKVYPENGFYLKEILQWPVEWSAVNGIAEIKFPLGKISACTDYFPDKKLVKLEGSKYPSEGESGVVFPYDLKNGFRSSKNQTESHLWLVNELVQNLAGRDFKTLIDLGAGNGDLVRYIRKYVGLTGTGVDNLFENDVVIKIDIKEFVCIGVKWKYDIALIAEQRFSDTFGNKELGLEFVEGIAKNVLIYNYSTRKSEWVNLTA